MSGYGSPPPGGNFYPREIPVQPSCRCELTCSSTSGEEWIWCDVSILTRARHRTDTKQTSTTANSSTSRLRQAASHTPHLHRLLPRKDSSRKPSTTLHHRVGNSNIMRRLQTTHSSSSSSSSTSLPRAVRLLSINRSLSSKHSTSRLSSCSPRKVP